MPKGTGSERNEPQHERSYRNTCHAPLHFIDGGRDVSHIQMNRLVGPARVIHISHKKFITLEEIEPFNISRGERILFPHFSF